MKVSAKCMNHSGCLKAYRGEIIELDPGAPLVCPECGKPLAKAGGGAGGAVKGLAIAVVVLVLAVGAVVGMKLMKKGGGSSTGTDTPPAADTTPSPSNTSDTPPPPPPPTDTPSKTTSVTPPSATPAPEPPPPADEPPPAAPVATNEPVTDTVKQEVLKRIDKMPNMLAEKKDRLYAAVDRTRNMQKVVEIGFSSGASSMPASSGPQVKKLLESPEVMKYRDNPDCVFVVLGFADAKGSEQANLAISEKRAKSVVDFMEKQCAVRSVTHAVAMGGTNLVDKNNAAKNRIVEIWVVLP